MKHYLLLFLNFLLFQPLLAQQKPPVASTEQSKNPVVGDSIKFKLSKKKTQQLSPFPDVKTYQRTFSEWAANSTDSTYPAQQKLQHLVRLAVLAIPHNAPDKPHQLAGFYRSVSTEQEKYTKLIEAVVTIQDTDYKSEHNRDNLKVQLKHLRQSHELGLIDSTIIKGARAYSKNGPKVVSSNYLYRLNQINLIRGHYRPGHIFNAAGWLASGHRFKLSNVSVAGKDTIYTIAFEGKADPKYSIGYLKINAKDKAIVEYEHSNYVFGDFMGKILVRSRKQESRYYPEFIKYEIPRLINGNIGVHQLDIHALWLEPPVLAKFEAIRKKDQMDDKQEVHLFRRPYDADFWASYQVLKLHPLEPRIKFGLEASISLDNQFRENAAK
ncbi:MAG: hypothetical protein ACO1OF_17555 [Adhaeribacter sp.]